MGKKRYSVTLADSYTDGFNELVEERGLYVDPQGVIRAGLRLVFEKHGVEGFSQLPPGDPKTLIAEAIEMLEEMLKRIQDKS